MKHEEIHGFKPRAYRFGPPGPGMDAAMARAKEAMHQRRMATFEAESVSFHSHRRNAVGDGPAYRYGRAWSDQYGWLGDVEDRMVLRLHGDEDRNTLHKDLLEGAPKLRSPKSMDGNLHPVSKQLSLSGSLPVAAWDGDLVDALLQDGWPVLFLPHTTSKAFEIPHWIDMNIAIADVTNAERISRLSAIPVMSDDPWIDHFHRSILKRLAHMPVDYAFNIQRILRELCLVAMLFARQICSQGGGAEALTIIGMDLFRSTVRAMAIGVASLSYHGWGFDAVVPRKNVRMFLAHLRHDGPQNRRDLQRKYPLWLGAATRDTLIEQLVTLGLVQCDGSRVLAVPLADFIPWLGCQGEFPAEGCLSSLLLGHKCRQALPLPGGAQKPKRRRQPRVTSRAGDQVSEKQAEAVNTPPEAA